MSEIEECFKRFVKRDDIDIILINQNVAEMVRHVIDAHTSPVPAVLEIPSKDHPYDASKDSILRRAKVKPYCFLNFVSKPQTDISTSKAYLHFSHTYITKPYLLFSQTKTDIKNKSPRFTKSQR